MSEKQTEQDAPLWILRKDQIVCLSSAVRMDMVDQLAGRGPMSIRELAAAIGMQPSAIYHHLRKLVAVELVREAGTRVVNRKSEKLYETPSRRMRLRRALEDPANAALMRDIVEALCRQAERDFAAGQAAGGSAAPGEARNLGFFRLIARPGPEALGQINARLEEVAEIMWRAPDPDQPALALTWIMAPKP
ncbi:MAG TPA: helix-turn-helix domain-containing protein [Sphingobium sp.]|nr:helix-turn-helix domain-containing protein [Sphingobium sp.]